MSQTELRTSAGQADPGASGTGVAAVILDAEGIRRATKRIAHEILERDDDAEDLVLVAIQQGGVPVGELIAEHLREILGITVTTSSPAATGRHRVPRACLSALVASASS
jgi:hypoxanthine phosphoribosyltransferase